MDLSVFRTTVQHISFCRDGGICLYSERGLVARRYFVPSRSAVFVVKGVESFKDRCQFIVLQIDGILSLYVHFPSYRSDHCRLRNDADITAPDDPQFACYLAGCAVSVGWFCSPFERVVRFTEVELELAYPLVEGRLVKCRACSGHIGDDLVPEHLPSLAVVVRYESAPLSVGIVG